VELDTPIRLHINGCPNSCGQQQIADIGLMGGKMKTSDGMIEAYTVSVGGHLGDGATFNTPLKGRVPSERVAPVLKELILYYKEHRKPEEPFWRFVRRVGVDALQRRFDEILSRTSAS
jgi:ferredoxin-nitrite reductase